MEQRVLGKSGGVVSLVGLGTWPMGGEWWGGRDDAVSIRTIHRARELGVTLLDTAEAYAAGHAEPENSPATPRSPQSISAQRRSSSSRTSTSAAWMPWRPLRPIAVRTGLTVPQLAISWLLSRPGMSTVVGARTVPEIEENVGGAETSISVKDLAAADAATHAVFEFLPRAR